MIVVRATIVEPRYLSTAGPLQLFLDSLKRFRLKHWPICASCQISDRSISWLNLLLSTLRKIGRHAGASQPPPLCLLQQVHVVAPQVGQPTFRAHTLGAIHHQAPSGEHEYLAPAIMRIPTKSAVEFRAKAAIHSNRSRPGIPMIPAT